MFRRDGVAHCRVIAGVAQLPLQRRRIEAFQHGAIVQNRLDLAIGQPDQLPDVGDDIIRPKPSRTALMMICLMRVAGLILELVDQVLLRIEDRIEQRLIGDVEIEPNADVLAEKHRAARLGKGAVDLLHAERGRGVAERDDSGRTEP